MGRFWSLLFLSVPILGVAVFAYAAVSETGLMANHWFPEDISEHGHVIDKLFLFILALTGIIFVGTGLVLFAFLWKYDADKTNGQPVAFVHGSHVLEVVWSILPAATLFFIAIYQMDAWATAKMRRPMAADGKTHKPPTAEVTGRQFEWRIRYPGPDGVLGNRDDLFTVNDLHIPVDEEIVLSVKSEDVLHSFFLPNLRVKQDVVPGMQQYVWFKPLREGYYDIVCAELCGWGHYKMKGRVTVESASKFKSWLTQLESEQNQAAYEPVVASEEE